MNRTEPQSYQDFDSLPARVFGVIRSPRLVFRTIIDRPRWADVMILTLAITVGCGVALMQTEVGRLALVDQWERTAAAFGRDVDEAQHAQLEEWSQNGAAYAAVNAVIMGPVATCALAAIIFGIFSVGLGGRGSYRQVLAIVAHAAVILAVRQVVAAPLEYANETLASQTTLTMFFPMFDEASPAARFFGVIDLFVVWWLVVLAVGVSQVYQRPLRRLAVAFMGAYVGFAVLLAIVMVVTGGTR